MDDLYSQSGDGYCHKLEWTKTGMLHSRRQVENVGIGALKYSAAAEFMG